MFLFQFKFSYVLHRFFYFFFLGVSLLSFSVLRSTMVLVLIAAVGVLFYLYGLPGRDR